jgi:hypothetical protein
LAPAVCAVGAAWGAACGLDTSGTSALEDDGGPASGDAADDAPESALDDERATDGDAAPDAPEWEDAGPLPIVWDGGPIGDPTFSESDWTQFCVTLAACEPTISISRCMAHLPQPGLADPVFAPQALPCVANQSPDCGQVMACLNDGKKCDPSTPAACVAGAFVSCAYGFKVTTPCRTLGMVCSAGAGNPGCGFGDCAPSQSGRTYCAGQYLVVCHAGRFEPRFDCQSLGASCGGPAGSAGCVGTSGLACSPSPAWCPPDGGAMQLCLSGHPDGVDCAQLYQSAAFECVTGVPPDGGAGCARGAACDGTYPDSCDSGGLLAIFCSAGGVAQFDCTSQHWKSCKAGRCAP